MLDMRFGVLGGCVFALLLACCAPARAESGDTLRLVRSRGALRCGVTDGAPGFTTRDASGAWTGFDVDFCRAVAAVALRDATKVRFVSLRATARFPAIASREIDLLSNNTTWTVSREAAFSIVFVGVTYFDSQALMVRADGPFAHGEPLEGVRICAEKGSNELDDLSEYARARGWSFTPVVAPEFGTAHKQFLDGACQALTDDRSALGILREGLPDPSAYVIRPEVIAKEPLGPAVRWDDGQWLTLVRAVYATLIDAEERGMTQERAKALIAGRTDAAGAAYLDETAHVSRALGIAPDWAARVIAAVGNYGEMFRRNLGSGSPLKLDPGPNRPWTEGGLLYAPPFQ